MLKNITPGIGELYRRAFRRAQVRVLQQFVPALKVSDVMRYNFTKSLIINFEYLFLNRSFEISPSQLAL